MYLQKKELQEKKNSGKKWNVQKMQVILEYLEVFGSFDLFSCFFYDFFMLFGSSNYRHYL